MYSDRYKKEMEKSERRLRIAVVVAVLLIVFAVGFIITGCSASHIQETYDSSGALMTRSWRTNQWGTTRQASMSMMQSESPDGTARYDIETGENVSVDPQTVEIIRLPLDTALGMYGIGQAARVERRQIRADVERERIRNQPVEVEE